MPYMKHQDFRMGLADHLKVSDQSVPLFWEMTDIAGHKVRPVFAESNFIKDDIIFVRNTFLSRSGALQ